MKKLFTCIAALMAAVAINATQVTLNPASMPQQTTAGAYDQTVNGIRVQISNGIVNTSEMRIYKGKNLTLSAESPISAIVFTCTASGTAQYGPGCFDAQDGYSYEGNKGTWLGSATSVSFATTANQVRASKIVVYLDGEQPSSEVVPLDTISVSNAIARIKDGKTDECCVKGVVAGDPFLLGANGPAFYLTDIEDPNDSLEGFKIGKDANTAYKDVEEMSQDIAMGDTIIICALGLAKYNNIFETTGGYYVRTVGKFKAIELDWAEDGEATRFADHWELSIAKVSGNEQNVIKLAFASDKVDAIAGNHYLAQGSSITIDGAETAITSGSVKLTFKELGGTGLNTYVTKVKAVAGDDIYVLSAEIEFYAQDEEFEEIDLVGDRPFVPTEGQLITCAQARSYALSLADGEEGTITFSVEGYVTDLFTDGTQFWMDDAQGNKTQTILIYKFKSLTPAGIALKNDAKVKVSGKAKNYGGKPEVVNAAVEVIEGGGEVTVVEVTVAGALAACQALAQNATSTETYAITGFIINIAREYSEQYGNISFWMSDNASDEKGDFEAYNVKCDATLAAKLLPGAKVKVTDKLKHFHQDATEGDNPKPERTVYETLGGGSVELLAGAGVEDITVNVKAAKFIYDGQLYILRDNAIYNVQGQLVK